MKQLTARDVMSTGIQVLTTAMTVREAATFLVDHEISGAPVEDSRGELVGVLSMTDIARSTSEGGSGLGARDHAFYNSRWEEVVSQEDLGDLHFADDSLQVADVMTPIVLAVDGGVPVREVARSMLDGHVHRLLVTDAKKVIGIITTSDLLDLLINQQP